MSYLQITDGLNHNTKRANNKISAGPADLTVEMHRMAYIIQIIIAKRCDL